MTNPTITKVDKSTTRTPPGQARVTDPGVFFHRPPKQIPNRQVVPGLGGFGAQGVKLEFMVFLLDPSRMGVLTGSKPGSPEERDAATAEHYSYSRNPVTRGKGRRG